MHEDTMLFDETYWLDLRGKTSVIDTGSRYCDVWCMEALTLLDQIEHTFKFVTAVVPIKFMPRMVHHSWLEAPTEGGSYVADGTAGQIDPKFQLGYYGFKKDAPDALRRIYLLRHPL